MLGYNMKPILVIVFIFFLSACSTHGDADDQTASKDQCLSQSDKERLLNLDEEAFDQDPSNGWRAIAAKAGCELAAADLIRDYRERHGLNKTIVIWHEGQMRAIGNDDAAAIRLFEQSRKPESQNVAGWNEYVDASIAFLRRDKRALLQARNALSAVDIPPSFDVKDGMFEIPNKSGKPQKMRWPPNIDVVDGLIKCYEKSYRDAYSDPACRAPGPR